MKCLYLGQVLSNYCFYSQWYLVHAYILAWPLECSHPYLTFTSISQSIRHATLSCKYNHFEFWSECLPWSVLGQVLKVLWYSGERYRAIMALLFLFLLFFCVCVGGRGGGERGMLRRGEGESSEGEYEKYHQFVIKNIISLFVEFLNAEHTG